MPAGRQSSEMKLMFSRDGQLDETHLTLGDLRAVSEEFELVLSSLRHRRVDYPGFDFDALPAESRLQVVGR